MSKNSDLYAKMREDLVEDERNIPWILDEMIRISIDFRPLQDDLMLLKLRYNKAYKANQQGMVTDQEYNTDIIRIVKSLLSYIEELAQKDAAREAAPPIPAPNRQPARNLGPTEVKAIVSLLNPVMGTASARYALMVGAFGPGSPLLSRVDLEGNTHVVTTLLVNSLIEYGKVNDGGTLRPALWVLLQKAKEYYGPDKQQQIDAFRPYFE